MTVVQAQVQFDQSYYYDDLSILTINDVNGIDFHPFTGDLRQGIFKGTTWIKVAITKSKDFDQISLENNVFPLIVGVGNFNLDHIEIYESVKGSWVKQIADRIHLQSPRVCYDDLHCFNLKTRLIDPEIQNVYVKINTQSFRTIHIEVRPQNLLASSSIARVYQIASTVSFGFCLFLLSLIFFLIERSRILLVYALFELSIVAYLYVSSGINYNIFDFNLHLFAYSLSLFLFNIRLLLFICICYLAIVDYFPSKIYISLCKTNFLGVCVCLLLALAGLRSLSLELNLFLQAFVVLLNIYGVLSCRSIKTNIKIILLLGYFVYLFLYVVGLIHSIQLFDFDLSQFFGFQNFYDFRLNGMPIGVVVFSIVAIQILSNKKDFYQSASDSKINETKVFYLNEKLIEREEMVEILSHEIKNPLSTIRFASNSIEKNTLVGSDFHARASIINRSISRIDELINQVYLSNQLEKNVFQKSIEKLNLFDLVTEVIGEFNSIHRFNLDIPATLSINSNESLLFTIFTNLIGNSIKYAKPESIIDLTIFFKPQLDNDTSSLSRVGEQSEQKIVFLISNHVLAVNTPDPTKMFNRYYRHENFLTKPGMGIGLNIVKSAIDLLHGNISCSVSNSIVSFNLEIPVS